MTISSVWQINKTTIESDKTDGYITRLEYRVKGMDGSEEKTRRAGAVEFVKPSGSLPSDFISFNDLKESDCLTWIKDSLGSSTVVDIENSIKSEIDLINTPVKNIGGAPW
tara:strand:+ start:6020 stop:6349 length:330 start_codon:yes stop_codon:yes gene_type:complete